MPRQLSVSAVARVERLCGLGDRHGRGANALRAPAVPTCGGGALPRGGEPGLRAYVCPNCDAVYNVLVYPESPLRPEVKSSATIMSSTPRRPPTGCMASAGSQCVRQQDGTRQARSGKSARVAGVPNYGSTTLRPAMCNGGASKLKSAEALRAPRTMSVRDVMATKADR
jgi:hypothetical protein